MLANARATLDHAPQVAMGSPDQLSRSERPGRVLTVDDHDGFRRLIRRVVDATPGLDAVAEATSGEGAVAAAEQLEPDLVVMDVLMPGIGGIDATRRIKARSPHTVVVLVSTTHPDELPPEAAASRADAILWKQDLRPRMLENVWQRHRG